MSWLRVRECLHGNFCLLNHGSTFEFQIALFSVIFDTHIRSVGMEPGEGACLL